MEETNKFQIKPDEELEQSSKNNKNKDKDSGSQNNSNNNSNSDFYYNYEYFKFLCEYCSINIKISKFSAAESKEKTELALNDQTIDRKIVARKEIPFYDYLMPNMEYLSSSTSSTLLNSSTGNSSSQLSLSSFDQRLSKSVDQLHKIGLFSSDQLSNSSNVSGSSGTLSPEHSQSQLDINSKKMQRFKKLQLNKQRQLVKNSKKNISGYGLDIQTNVVDLSRSIANSNSILSPESKRKSSKSGSFLASSSSSRKRGQLFRVFRSHFEIPLEQKILKEEYQLLDISINVGLSSNCPMTPVPVLPRIFLNTSNNENLSRQKDKTKALVDHNIKIAKLLENLNSRHQNCSKTPEEIHNFIQKQCFSNQKIICKIVNNNRPSIIGFEKPKYVCYMSENFLEIKIFNDYNYKIRIGSDTGRPDLVTDKNVLFWPIEKKMEVKQDEATLFIKKICTEDDFLLTHAKSFVTIYNNLTKSKILKISTQPKLGKIKQSDKKFKIIISQTEPEVPAFSSEQNLDDSLSNFGGSTLSLAESTASTSTATSTLTKKRKLYQKDVTWPCLILRDENDEYELIPHSKKPLLYHEVHIDQNLNPENLTKDKKLQYNFELEIFGASNFDKINKDEKIVEDEFVFEQPGSTAKLSVDVKIDKSFTFINFQEKFLEEQPIKFEFQDYYQNIVEQEKTNKVNFTDFESPFITAFDIIQNILEEKPTDSIQKRSNNFILDRYLNYQNRSEFCVEYEIKKNSKSYGSNNSNANIRNLDEIMIPNYPPFYKNTDKVSDVLTEISVKLSKLEIYQQDKSQSSNYKIGKKKEKLTKEKEKESNKKSVLRLDTLTINIINNLYQPRISVGVFKHIYKQSEGNIHFKLNREDFMNVDVEVLLEIAIFDFNDKNELQEKATYSENHIIKCKQKDLLISKQIDTIDTQIFNDLSGSTGHGNTNIHGSHLPGQQKRLSTKLAIAKNAYHQKLICKKSPKTIVKLFIIEAFYENLYYNKKKYLIKNRKNLENIRSKDELDKISLKKQEIAAAAAQSKNNNDNFSNSKSSLDLTKLSSTSKTSICSVEELLDQDLYDEIEIMNDVDCLSLMENKSLDIFDENDGKSSLQNKVSISYTLLENGCIIHIPILRAKSYDLTNLLNIKAQLNFVDLNPETTEIEIHKNLIEIKFDFVTLVNLFGQKLVVEISDQQPNLKILEFKNKTCEIYFKYSKLSLKIDCVDFIRKQQDLTNIYQFKVPLSDITGGSNLSLLGKGALPAHYLNLSMLYPYQYANILQKLEVSVRMTGIIRGFWTVILDEPLRINVMPFLETAAGGMQNNLSSLNSLNRSNIAAKIFTIELCLMGQIFDRKEVQILNSGSLSSLPTGSKTSLDSAALALELKKLEELGSISSLSQISQSNNNQKSVSVAELVEPKLNQISASVPTKIQPVKPVFDQDIDLDQVPPIPASLLSKPQKTTICVLNSKGKSEIPIKLPNSCQNADILLKWDLICHELSMGNEFTMMNNTSILKKSMEAERDLIVSFPTHMALNQDEAEFNIKINEGFILTTENDENGSGLPLSDVDFKNDFAQFAQYLTKIPETDFPKQEIQMNLKCDFCRPTVGFKPGYINGIILNNQLPNIKQSILKVNLKFIRTGWMKSTIKARLITNSSKVTNRQQNILFFKPNQIMDNCTILLKNNVLVDQDLETICVYLEIISGENNPRIDPANAQLNIPIILDVGLTFIKFKEVQVTGKITQNSVIVPMKKETGGKTGHLCQATYQIEWFGDNNNNNGQEYLTYQDVVVFSKLTHEDLELVIAYPTGFSPVRGLITLLDADFADNKNKGTNKSSPESKSKIKKPTFNFLPKTQNRKIKHSVTPCRIIILQEAPETNSSYAPSFSGRTSRGTSECGSTRSKNSKFSGTSSISFGKELLRSTGINLTSSTKSPWFSKSQRLKEPPDQKPSELDHIFGVLSNSKKAKMSNASEEENNLIYHSSTYPRTSNNNDNSLGNSKRGSLVKHIGSNEGLPVVKLSEKDLNNAKPEQKQTQQNKPKPEFKKPEIVEDLFKYKNYVGNPYMDLDQSTIISENFSELPSNFDDNYSVITGCDTEFEVESSINSKMLGK